MGKNRQKAEEFAQTLQQELIDYGTSLGVEVAFAKRVRKQIVRAVLDRGIKGEKQTRELMEKFKELIRIKALSNNIGSMTLH